MQQFPQQLRGTKSREKALLKSLYEVFLAKREFIHRTRAGTMTQAATIFEQIGDTAKTIECHHLLNIVNGE